MHLWRSETTILHVGEESLCQNVDFCLTTRTLVSDLDLIKTEFNKLLNLKFQSWAGVSVSITKSDGTTITKDSPEYDEDEQRKVINIFMPGKEQVITITFCL